MEYPPLDLPSYIRGHRVPFRPRLAQGLAEHESDEHRLGPEPITIVGDPDAAELP